MPCLISLLKNGIVFSTNKLFMFNTIKTKLKEINNQAHFGISCNAPPRATLYFLEIINSKRDVDRFYVTKKEFDILYDLNIEKIAIIKKLKAKQKRDNKKLKEKKLKENKLRKNKRAAQS